MTYFESFDYDETGGVLRPGHFGGSVGSWRALEEEAIGEHRSIMRLVGEMICRSGVESLGYFGD